MAVIATNLIYKPPRSAPSLALEKMGTTIELIEFMVTSLIIFSPFLAAFNNAKLAGPKTNPVNKLTAFHEPQRVLPSLKGANKNAPIKLYLPYCNVVLD
jgi:hypothetical protein